MLTGFCTLSVVYNFCEKAKKLVFKTDVRLAPRLSFMNKNSFTNTSCLVKVDDYKFYMLNISPLFTVSFASRSAVAGEHRHPVQTTEQ